jgi:hypothetical protein
MLALNVIVGTLIIYHLLPKDPEPVAGAGF